MGLNEQQVQDNAFRIPEKFGKLGIQLAEVNGLIEERDTEDNNTVLVVTSKGKFAQVLDTSLTLENFVQMSTADKDRLCDVQLSGGGAWTYFMMELPFDEDAFAEVHDRQQQTLFRSLRHFIEVSTRQHRGHSHDGKLHFKDTLIRFCVT